VFQFCPGQEGTSILRRALLVGGFAGAVNCAFPRVAHAATAIALPTANGNRRFSVLYKGERIGAHTVSYSSATGETRVNAEIHLLVKVAFFTAFAFSHLRRDLARWAADVAEQRNGGAWRDPPRL
jgi:uncharacterized protein DUF6134